MEKPLLPQKVACLDLDTRQVKIREIPEETTRSFLGGRGINMHLLYRHTKPATDPLSTENPLIVGTGLLTGLKGLGATRCSISGKSPETGLLGDSNIGGHFGAFMKRTGIDCLLITGASKTPVYIYLDGEKIGVEDAQGLWGKSTTDANLMLKKRHGPSSESIAIGIAGENLVRFAGIINRRKNTAGRTGMGCLMGSKKIKAIVVNSKREIHLKDKDSFNTRLKQFQQKLNDEPLVKLLREFGSPFLFMLINRRIGMGRAYNGQSAKFSESEEISPRILKERYYQKRAGCFYCPVACHHEYVAGGVVNEGPEYTIFASFGPVVGIRSIEKVLVINNLINRYGLDGSSTANLIAWSIELFTRGIINKNTTGGLKLAWGDDEVIIELIHQVAQRKGFGNLLADGAKDAVKSLGTETGKYLIWTKYLPQSDPIDLRYFPAYALGNAVASRGSDHLRSRPTWEAYGIPEETLKEIYGGYVPADPRSYEGKGRVIWWWGTYLALIDALGLCKLIAHNSQPGLLDFQFFADLIRYATGLRLTPDEIFAAGERIITQERLFLVREGISREDDFPPQRYFEPLVWQEDLKPEEKNLALDRASYERMLDEYYELHGWDREGKPFEKTIQRLGLD